MRALSQHSPGSAPMGSSARRLLMTSSTAASLFGMFMLYAIIVRPIIKAPEVPVKVHPGPGPGGGGAERVPNEYADLARKYLPSQEWAINSAYQMSIENGTVVFFENWERGQDNDANSTQMDDAERDKLSRTIRFKPFAMIWIQKGKNSDDEPICIVSDSARVEFVRKFDFPNPQPGRVIGGALEGAVRITGADNMSVVGRNFHYTEDAMKVFSDDDVNFTYKQNTGRAHGMQLELIPDEVARKQDRFAASGVRKIMLQQNVAMNLVSDPEPPKDKAKAKAKAKAPTDVNVRSVGSFSFTIETSTASFEDQVNVRSVPRDKPNNVDQIQCDLLSLIFARKANDNKKNPAPAAAPKPNSGAPAEQQVADKKGRFETMGGNMSFKRLIAQSYEDRENNRDVVLSSKANNLTAWMNRLIYDGETKVAELTSNTNVRVTQDASEIQSPTIQIVHNDDSEITQFSCRGAGWLKNVDPKTQKLQLAAQWQKELRKKPDPTSDLDILEFEKEAILQQPAEKMGLKAEFIRLWFERQSRKNKPNPQTAKRPDGSPSVRPKRLLAENAVVLDSPQIVANGTRLEAWFEEVAASPDSNPKKENSADRSKAAPSATDAKSRQTVGEVRPANDPFSNESKPTSPAPEKQDDQQLDGPLNVHADLIRVLVVIPPDRRGAQVSEVLMNGNVDLQQLRKGATEPLHATGENMSVVNHGSTEQTIVVKGAPAHIRSTEMHIEGQKVDLDRLKNFARVTGAGVLELPVSQDMDGNKLPNPELLAIRWDKKMTFDGKEAEFLENVRARLRENEMRCAKMKATTTRRYSFTDPPPKNAEKMEIETIHCLGGVEFESQQYEGNKISEQRQGQFVELLMNRLTGATAARGPGYILSWQRGHGRRAGFIPTATVKANASSVSKNSDWEFSRIHFSGTMTGNINQQTTTFRDRVQIVYGPVAQPQQTIDPDAGLPEGGGWMRCSTLNVTRRKDPEHADGFVELLAQGNAELEGQKFFAQADEVTYDESKGLYTLRGEGTHSASITQQKQVGGKPSPPTVAQRIEFMPAQNSAKVIKSTGSGGDF